MNNFMGLIISIFLMLFMMMLYTENTELKENKYNEAQSIIAAQEQNNKQLLETNEILSANNALLSEQNNKLVEANSALLDKPTLDLQIVDNNKEFDNTILLLTSGLVSLITIMLITIGFIVYKYSIYKYKRNLYLSLQEQHNQIVKYNVYK